MGHPNQFFLLDAAAALCRGRDQANNFIRSRFSVRRFSRNDSGSVAVEFGIASTVVLALIFSAVDMGRVFIVGGLLGDAARQISRENQVRENPYPAVDFNTAADLVITARSGGMLNPALVSISTDVYRNFEDLGADQPIEGGPPGGEPSQIVKYRLEYAMDYYTPFIDLLMNGAQFQQVAEIIVFNEPETEL